MIDREKLRELCLLSRRKGQGFLCCSHCCLHLLKERGSCWGCRGSSQRCTAKGQETMQHIQERKFLLYKKSKNSWWGVKHRSRLSRVHMKSLPLENIPGENPGEPDLTFNIALLRVGCWTRWTAEVSSISSILHVSMSLRYTLFISQISLFLNSVWNSSCYLNKFQSVLCTFCSPYLCFCLLLMKYYIEGLLAEDCQ